MDDLKELLRQEAELRERIENARKAQKAEAISQVMALVSMYNLKLEECGFRCPGADEDTKSRAPRAPKYVSPDGETWSGIGRPPKWAREIKESGGDLEKYLVEKATGQAPLV